MKHSLKWAVVPYGSFSQQNAPKSIYNVLQNKSLTNDEKIAIYNDLVIKKLRKNEHQNINSIKNTKNHTF